MPQELSHDGSLEERIIKDDFLLFLGEVSEIRCEPKFVIRGLYFGPSHYMVMWSEDRGKITGDCSVEEMNQLKGDLVWTLLSVGLLVLHFSEEMK